MIRHEYCIDRARPPWHFYRARMGVSQRGQAGENSKMILLQRVMRASLFAGYLGSYCFAQTPTLVQHISSGRDNTTGYSSPTYRLFLPNPTLSSNCLILRFEHASSFTTSSVTTDKGDTFARVPSIDSNGHVLESYYVPASTGSQIVSVVTAGNVGSEDAASGDLSEFYNTNCVADASGSSASRSVALPRIRRTT